jgi:hypothetical protein
MLELLSVTDEVRWNFDLWKLNIYKEKKQQPDNFERNKRTS